VCGFPILLIDALVVIGVASLAEVVAWRDVSGGRCLICVGESRSAAVAG
jgi:hypothetical protein